MQTVYEDARFKVQRDVNNDMLLTDKNRASIRLSPETLKQGLDDRTWWAKHSTGLWHTKERDLNVLIGAFVHSGVSVQLVYKKRPAKRLYLQFK
jgi:hypothetical protein